MSRATQLAKALETAFGTRAPIVLFGGWQPAGSLPASVGLLIVGFCNRLAAVPLNATMSSVPYSRDDDIAIQGKLRASRITSARGRARAYRYENKCNLQDDFSQSDWEIAAQTIASDPIARVELRSVIAVDHYDANARLRYGTRPQTGNRTKHGPRLPQLRVVTVRAWSPRSLEAAVNSDLVLIGLNTARGTKTCDLAASALNALNPDTPTLILAEDASELARYASTRVFSPSPKSICLVPPPADARLQVVVLGQERAQYEQQFRYAMPEGELTPAEHEVADLGAGVWRQRWRTIDTEVRSSRMYERFLQAVRELRRSQRGSADRFNMLVQLLGSSADDAAAAAADRRSTLLTHLSQEASNGASRILVVVGGTVEEQLLKQSLAPKLRAIVVVAAARHLKRMRVRAESVIVAGYFGPATLDVVLRAGPRSVRWLTDPVEGGQAASELHRQGALLLKLGMPGMAATVGRFDSALRGAVGGARAAEAYESSLFAVPTAPTVHDYSADDRVLVVEEVDADADRVLTLADGTHLHVNANRRFDVLRSQSPNPDLVRAEDLQEGDHILVVGGTYQKTLSELLLEEMDRTTLKREATSRRDWVRIVQVTMEIKRLTADDIARRMRGQGISIRRHRVQTWLRGNHEESTPRDWPTFLAFARTVGIALPEDQLRDYFSAIKVWRVGHQKRGRDVVRAVRAAYFGGLTAADLSRIESEWGLGVRDLIEGCRVEEVEATSELLRGH